MIIVQYDLEGLLEEEQFLDELSALMGDFGYGIPMKSVSTLNDMPEILFSKLVDEDDDPVS